jgi:DNA-directed RNA polymerase specialized sigma24 family protein
MSQIKSGVIAVPIDQYQYLVEKGLSRLSEIERRAIFLSFWQPNSVEQVAMQMQLSLDGTSRIIDRAVKKIQAVFIEHGHMKKA